VLHGFVANSTRRWSGLRYKLGPRGIVELIAERWLRLAHMTVLLGLLVAACSVVSLN
jgi:hypothetical protein